MMEGKQKVNEDHLQHLSIEDKWRFLFMRGLIDHESSQRTRHYLKSAAECTSRAIVSLELADNPIRSVKQARQLEGIGGETCVRLTKLAKEHSFSILRPIGGRFVSSAGAILVALLEAGEYSLQQGHSTNRDVLIPEDTVRRRSMLLAEERFEDDSGDPAGFCKAWWRLEVLIKRGYIRRRSLKKSPVLQLLPLGKDTAQRLRGDDISLVATSSGVTTLPVPPSGIPPLKVGKITHTDPNQSCREIKTTSNQKETLEDALYTNDKGADGIVMLVDTQEMGGERAGLGQLCEMLNQSGICYKTRRLATGDYSWLWRWQGRELVLPCLVERKRADDVACTLKEGRFWTQVKKMVAWQSGFTQHGVECSLHYILERQPEEYVVKCADRCEGVGRCGNPSLTQVKMAIRDLKCHPQLQVKETDSLEVTVILLTSLTAELTDRSRRGDFDGLLQEALSDTHVGPAGAPERQGCKGVSLIVEHKGIEVLAAGRQIGSGHFTAGIDGIKCSPSNTPITAELYKDVKTEIDIKERLSVDGLAENSGFYMDTSFEEQLQIAMRRSVSETRTKEIKNMRDTDRAFHSEFLGNAMATAEHSGAVKEEEMDADLIQAINESKRMSTPGINNFENKNVDKPCTTIEDCEDLTHPLMQYHCSAGGSVNYPATSTSRKEREVNVYRPKMNRKRKLDISKDHDLDSGTSSADILKECAVNDNWKGYHVKKAPLTLKNNVTSENNLRTNRCMYDENRLFGNNFTYSTSVRSENKLFDKKLASSTSTCNDIGMKQTNMNTKTDSSPEIFTDIKKENMSTSVKRLSSQPRLVITPSPCNIERNILSVDTVKYSGRKGRQKNNSSTNREVDRSCHSQTPYRARDKTLTPTVTCYGNMMPSDINAGNNKGVKYSGGSDQECEKPSTSVDNYVSDEDLFPDTDLVTTNMSDNNTTNSGTHNNILSDHFSDRDSPDSLPELDNRYTCNRNSTCDRDSPESLPDLNMVGVLKNIVTPVRSGHRARRSSVTPVKPSGTNIVHTSKDTGLQCSLHEVGMQNSVGPMSSEMEDMIRTVRSVLPQVSRDEALGALRQAQTNVEAAISYLLETESHALN